MTALMPFHRVALVSFLLAIGAALVLPGTARAGPLLPDLIVESISSAQDLGDCTSPAGVNVVVRNIGNVPAGQSVTFVGVGGQTELVPTPGIAAGEAVTVYSSVTGVPIGDTYKAEADFEQDVTESNEDNNWHSEFLQITTLATCTPTPEPTPTATPTPAPPVGGVASLLEEPAGVATAPSEAWSRTGWVAALIATVAAGVAVSAVLVWRRRQMAG